MVSELVQMISFTFMWTSFPTFLCMEHDFPTSALLHQLQTLPQVLFPVVPSLSHKSRRGVGLQAATGGKWQEKCPLWEKFLVTLDILFWIQPTGIALDGKN